MRWELTGGAVFPAPPLTSSLTLANALSLGFFISLVIRWLQLILPFVLPGASERVLCNLDGLARVRESSSSVLAFADLRGLLIREPRI